MRHGGGESGGTDRILALQPLECGADAEPAGQEEPALRPAEDPRDGAQVGQGAGSGAAGRTRSDATRLEDVDRGGLAVKLHETVCLEQCSVGFVAGFDQACHNLLEIAFRSARGGIDGKPAGAGEEQFEVEGGGDRVGKFLRDGFALLGDAQVAVERVGRQGFKKTVGRTGTATDRAAAAVEEAHARAVLGGTATDAFLGTMQRPLAGKNAAVFVAVTVADHDLLGGAEFTFGFGQGASEPLAAPREQVAVQPTQAGTRDRMIEKTGHDCRRALEVVDGFEKRHDGKGTNEAVGFPFGQSCFLGEEVNGEQVGNLARHADDGRTDALGAVTPHVIGQRAVGSEHGIGLGTCGNTVVEEVVRTREAFLEKGQPLLLRPCGEIGLGRARRGEDLLHGSVVERAVLPDIEGGKVETENFHHAEQRIDVGSNQAPRPDGQQALAEEAQVSFKFGRMPVGAGSVVEDKSARAGTFCQGQACDHEVDEFPPRFAPDFVACFAQDLGENGRRFL